MAYGIGGGGFVGLAWETTINTYVAPTIYIPILTESLSRPQDTQWRRPIRQNVDNLGGVPGNVHVEGDIEMEALAEGLIYFHSASRTTGLKTGAGAPWTYTYTPTAIASVATGKTLSITVVRNGVVFGYTGCVVKTFKYKVDAGQLKATISIIGSDEASQSLPTATWAGQAVPFGAGDYNIQIPTATQVFDADTFEWTMDDNAEPQYRMRSAGRGAQFIKFGERTVSMTTERDFQDRTDYDAFKALTAQTITLLATKSTLEQVQITMPAAIKDSYVVGLSGQGNLIRGAISYMGTYDATATNAYSVVIKSNTSITIP